MGQIEYALFISARKLRMKVLFVVFTGAIMAISIADAQTKKANADPVAEETFKQSQSTKTVQQHLYATDVERNAIYQFKIGTNGTLVPLVQPALATGNGPKAIALTPDNRFLYVGNQYGKSISQYSVGSDGSLSYANPLTVGTNTLPIALAVEPGGRVLYVACISKGTLLQFHIQADGTLIPLLASQIALRGEPSTMTIDAKGKTVLVGYRRDKNIDQFRIQANGTLANKVPNAVPSPPISSLVAPRKSQCVYAVLQNHSLIQFQESDEGNITRMVLLTVLDEIPSSLVFDGQSHFAYAVNNRSSTVSQYQVDKKNLLVPLQPPSVSTTDKPKLISLPTQPPEYVDKSTGPTSLTFSDVEKSAYVGNEDGSISCYRVNLNGTLSYRSPANINFGKSLTCVITVNGYDYPIQNGFVPK